MPFDEIFLARRAVAMNCQLPLGLRCFLLVCVLTLPSIARAADELPLQSDYRGEIRRGADGRLVVLPPQEPSRAVDAAPATMFVGPGERVSSITEAARLAVDGEVIEIRPGNYRGQPAIWVQNNLTIRGGGKRPVMLADGKSAEGKAIWVFKGGRARVENIEFRGARVPDGNGAAIRFERGMLTVQGCRFIDNEMGILTSNGANLSLEVFDSEFGDAPRHGGSLHHLLYVGQIGKFVLRGSRFYNGYLGHLVKSRARENHVYYNMLVDGEGGKASYELEFPNGGLAFIIGNAIGQSATTDNPTLVAYGAEKQHWQDNALYLVHNTLVNDHFSGNFLAVWPDKFPSGAEVWQINNLTVGNGDFFPPARGRVEGNQLAVRGDLIAYGGFPLRLSNLSPLRGTVRPPGSVRGVDLLPNAEFSPPQGTRPLRGSSALSPGAFQ